MKKRIFAILLALVLLCQAVPTQVFATGDVETPAAENGELIVTEGAGEALTLTAVEGEAPMLAAYDQSTGYPQDLTDDVYVAVYSGNGFPGEPAWYDQTNYTFIKPSGDGFTKSSGNSLRYSDDASDLLNEQARQNMTQGTPNGNIKVWGHYSEIGTDNYFANDTLIHPDNQELIIELVMGNRVSNPEDYEIVWYVVKYQTDTYWHIDGLIVKKDTYNVNYYGNGNTSGSAPTGATGLKLNDEYTVLGNDGNLKKTGYTFNGWNTQSDGKGTHYEPGAKITIKGNVSLYAEWIPNTTSIKVTKVWDDGENQDGSRPDSVTVHLLANGQHNTNRKVTLNAKGGWTHTWTDMDTVDSRGNTIAYTVEEEAVTGYTAKVESVSGGFTITNTHTPATTSVQAQKVWADDNNSEGMRPASVTLQLYKQIGNADPVAVGEPVAVSNDTSWTKQWHNLPKYEGGELITYSVQEVGTYTGYTASYDVDEHTGRLIVTNAYTSAKTSVEVTKAWEDNDNQDGIRPASVTVNLLANGKSAGKSVTLSAANNWNASFSELPVYANLAEIVYTVEEKAVTGYTAAVTGDAANGFTITNTHTPEKIDIPVTKVWDDANNQDGKRLDSVTVTLFVGNDVKGTLTLNANNQWSDVFEDLPKFADGKEIEYTVAEAAVNGYTAKVTGSVATGFTVTNSYTPEVTSVTITKEWDDADNQDGIRPSSVTVNVLADEAVVKTVTLTASQNWTATVTGLPKFANGAEIQYSVDEPTVPEGYTKSVDGFTVTNTHTPATTSVTVTKVWDHGGNSEWNYPDSVTFHLLANGQHTQKEVTLQKDTVQKDASGNWVYTWNDLDEYANGQKIQYSIAEESVTIGRREIYTASYSHTDPDNPNKITVTNTYDISNNISFHVEKIWNDDNNRDGIRPDSIFVTLYRKTNRNNRNNQRLEAVETIELKSDNGWEGVFSDYPKQDNRGNKYTYSVQETKYKTNGVTVDGIPNGYNTPNESPKYVLDEDINTFIITNTHTPETTSITVNKVWDDADNQDGIRPASITVNLKADGTVVDVLTLTEVNQWSGTFVDLPVYENGEEINYTVEEVAVEDYTSAVTGDAETGFTITNKHTPEKTKVSVTKAWDDASNQDGIRPTSVQVTLLADDVAVGEPVVLSAENEWSYTFENLDKYKAGQEIVYTVEEEAVTGYTSAITGSAANGYTITNTHTPDVISIPVIKVWDDTNNQDGKRPESITVTLYAGDVEKATLTLSAANNWNGVFDNLPKMAAGKEITYTLVEPAVPAYNLDDEGEAQPTTAQVVDGKFTIINTHKVEKTTMTLVKVWDDDNNRDKKRPQSVTFHLLADGEHTGITATLNGLNQTTENQWVHTWTNLDKYAAGNLIRYTVYEEDLADQVDLPDIYDVEYVRNSETQITATNSYTPETTEVSVEKIWNDGDNRDRLRPESITVDLYADGVKVNSLVLDAAGGWHGEFNNLPKNANGDPIVYTVQESEVPAGYTSTIVQDVYDPEGNVENEPQAQANVITNEFIITNTHVVEKTSVKVTKEWNDVDNQDGIRPESVEVVLFRNGTAYSEPVELNVKNGWSYTFADLFVNDGRGGQYIYTVVENTPEGYTSEVTGTVATGFTITNTHTPEKTEVTVTKTWDDANNQDGIRPESITAEIYAGETKVAETSVTAENNWTATVTGLPKYSGGVKIEYTAKEKDGAVPTGYTATAAGLTITNTHAPEVIRIPVTKVWNDASNQDGKRPASVTVNLKEGNQTVATLQLPQNGQWSGEFVDIPKYAGGNLITYTIEEVAVAEYTTEITGSVAEGFTITNTHKPEKISIPVTKTWVDADNQDGIRPDSITVNLYAGDAVVDTLTLTATGNWSGTFADLPKYAAGEEIEYTVEEESVEDYTASVDDFKITNTHEVAKTSVTVTKVWNDGNNQDGKRPASVTVYLLANGNRVDDAVAELNEGNKWTVTWSGLPVNAKGEEILYTVAEAQVEGYTNTIAEAATEGNIAFTVTNAYTPKVVDVNVEKVWNDENNQDGIRPATVTLQLYKQVGEDEAIATGNPVQVSNETKWSYKWSQLPKYESGKLITYSVKETAVPEDYEVSYAVDEETGYLIITNTHVPATIDPITVSKVWNDADDQDGIRPDSVTIALYANGNVVKTLTLTEEDKWSGKVENLPKFAKGEEITYTVKEVGHTIGTEDKSGVPAGYTADVDGYTVTNTHVPAVTEITVTKVWNDAHDQDGIRPDSITAQVYADGKAVATVELTAENNWKATVSQLPKNADGEPIVYTVKEKSVPAGYTATVDGFTITNTHQVAKTEVSVKKLWVDENDQDGKRPASVTAGLYADGVFTGKTVVLSAANGWYAEFENLDEFHQGKEITYTVLENVVIDYAPVYNYSVDANDGTTHVTITNVHAVDMVSIPVQKIWNDADDQDGKRPESITVTLYADGRTTGKTLTLSADNLWMDTFVGMPKNNDGKLIEYTVLEKPVDAYTAEIKAENGKFVITNTHEVEKTELTVAKVWKDNGDQDGKRPDSIVLHLLANGVRVDQVTLTAEGKWTYTWKDLDKFAAGQEITYSVYEEPVVDVAGAHIYTVSYKQDSATKITVTNAYTPEVTSVQTQKVWEDGQDRDGLRPESITVTLMGDGKKLTSIVLNEENEWTGAWTGLPKYEQGKVIQYTVVESDVPDGYESAVAVREDGQVIVTNTHAPATTGVTVEKIWADENDNDGKRPDGIIVQLYADGSAVENGKVVLDETNGWAYAWESTEKMPLYVFNQGELIHYYVQETGYIIDGVEYAGLPEGYVGSTATGENAYTVSITNTHVAEKIAVSVVKNWADADDQDGIRPESVEMTLMKNGTAVETVKLSADNEWTYTWKDLYKYAEGQLVKYTVQEVAVEGYEAAYTAAESDEQTVITVTNTHVAETQKVNVTKVWKDNNDEEDLRPDSVTVQLYKNGEAYGEPVKLSAANSWCYAAELPVYEAGEKIAWSVKEIGIPRYYTVSYDQSTLTVTNTIQSKDVPKSGDFNNLWMWFILMGGCTAGAVSVVLGGKKKGKYAK